MSWHHERWVSSCVESIAAAGSSAATVASVVVVDNARTLNALDLPTTPGTMVLGNDANAGFARACNQGARCGSAEFLLFLNPDTKLEPDALTRAVAAMRHPARPDVGIVGLQLVDFEGRVQRTCGRFPAFATAAAQVLGLSRLAPSRCPGFRMTDWDHQTTRGVDFVCGAALLVRRALFEELAGFDERLFLYLEDADLSLRARRLGWQTLFCADAGVEHACGWTRGQHRAWRLAQSWRSLVVYAWTHFSRSSACLLTALLLLAGPLVRVAEAIVLRRPSEALDGLKAWLLLVRLLLADRRPGGGDASSLELLPLTPDAQAPRRA